MPVDWINDQLRRQAREKWERDMRASSGSGGGCIVIPLALIPFLIGGFVVLVLIVHFAFANSDFRKQMDAQHLTVARPTSLQGRALNTNSAYEQGTAKRASDMTEAMGVATSVVSAVYGSSTNDFIVLAASQGGFMKSANR